LGEGARGSTGEDTCATNPCPLSQTFSSNPLKNIAGCRVQGKVLLINKITKPPSVILITWKISSSKHIASADRKSVRMGLSPRREALFASLDYLWLLFFLTPENVRLMPQVLEAS
jgi:hypothetical protein